MKLNTETYSDNEKISEINYDNKENKISIFIFDEDDEKTPYKTISINSNNKIHILGRSIDGEYQEELFSDNFQKLEEYNIDSFLMKDIINNNHAILELDQEELRGENSPKNIDKFNFLKETNQIELQISGHPDYESEEFIDIIQLYRINPDSTCQYSKGDSTLMIKKEDISNNTFNQYLKMYNIDSQKINNMASEINETVFSLNKRNTLS